MKPTQSPPLWHVLQISDVLDLEFAMALSESADVLAWEPMRSLAPWRVPAGAEPERLDASGNLRLRKLPLLRGFARYPIRLIADLAKTVSARLLQQTPEPASTALICTTPFFAPVAELWPGPVVYWLTDLIAEYVSTNRNLVHRLDRRLCRVASLVCPNSVRLENYLVDVAGCDREKICIIPNATRRTNLLPHASIEHLPPPPSLMGIPKPYAGIIGNLAGNMDWDLLRGMVASTPWLSWIFVGPTSMHIEDREQREARQAAMLLPNTHFVGKQPYGELASFARAFDVAVLPYRRHEPTYSGSSTRFYEHLAACRPMIATRGLEELTRKEPLLKLFDTTREGLDLLEHLRSIHFDDGLTTLRWNASQNGTWQVRAEAMQQALTQRTAAARCTSAESLAYQ